MISEVKMKLESVCCGKGWCYGVLWRFDHRNPMLLTVEGAYCEDQMEAVVHEMLQQVQLLGEGSIGQVAFTGKHRWMFCDAHNEQFSPNDPTNSKSLLLGDAELHRQFSNGIKTIAVIPVEQKGVLQFGSKEKILEKMELLHDLKKPFEMTKNTARIPTFNSDPSSISGLFASLLSTESSSHEDVKLLYGNGNKGVMSFGVLPQSSPHLPSIYSGRDSYEQPFLHPTFPVKVEPTNAPCISSRTGDFSVITSVESPLPTGVLIPGFHGLNHGDMSKNSLEESRLTLCGQKRPFREVEIAEEFADDTCTIDDLSQWFADLPGDIFSATASTFNLDKRHSAAASASSSSLVLGDYAYEAPLEINPSRSEEHVAYTESSRGDIFSLTGDFWGDNSIDACPMDLDGSWKGALAQLGMEDMLTNERSVFNSKQLEAENFSRSEMMNVVHLANGLSYARDLQAKEEIFPNSSIGMWIDDSHSNNRGAAVTRICKTEEPRKATKRRARPGESTRPRPKDRQLIQDRLKELRGMIPNGAKCSIDALLDRTVKHMQFLQNVTKYADRLKQAKMPKLIKRGKRSSCGSIDGSGATWAFTVDSQMMECPVIVEDLDARGQMLIEMLCEDRGLFLETADMVRGLGLSILKGEMEVRDGKLWSCFMVEAKRHVTRMDVFWSLMQLLRQKDPDGGLEGKVELHTDVINRQFGILHCNDYKQSAQPVPIGLTEIFR